MPDSAERSHQSADHSANPGVTAPGERAIIAKSFGETHADAGAYRSCQADRKCIMCTMGGEGGCKQRGERGNRTVHQAGEPGLHHLEHEESAAGFILPFAHLGRQHSPLQLIGLLRMRALLLG